MQTIVAGCTFATGLLKLLLLEGLDAVAAAVSKTRMAVVVDEVTIACVSRRVEVVSAVSEGARRLAEVLEGNCSMVPARKKTAVLASDTGVVKAIAARAGIGGEAVQTATKNLGVDFTAGLDKRVLRYRVLRKSGAQTAKLGRTGLIPAGKYGVGITGVSDTLLRSLRARARRATYLHTAGRSLTIDLAFAGGETYPAYVANREPIVRWLSALWDQVIPDQCLVRAFHIAMQAQADGKRRWAKVRGPAGAVVATLHRIGWVRESATYWQTHVGRLHVLGLCSKFCAKLIDQATHKQLWKKVAESSSKLDAVADP